MDRTRDKEGRQRIAYLEQRVEKLELLIANLANKLVDDIKSEVSNTCNTCGITNPSNCGMGEECHHGFY